MKFFGSKALAGPAVPTVRSGRRVKLPSGGMVAAALLAMLAAVFMGMVTALGSLPLTMVVAGAMLGLPILALINTRQMLPVLFVVVFLVQGTAQFYLHLRAATWLASGLAAMFLVRAVIETFDPKRRGPEDTGRGSNNVLVFGAVYLAVYLFSMALGEGTTAQRISSLRFSIPMFGVLLAMYWYHWDMARLQLMWKLVIFISFCQLPLTLYQHFFMMSTLSWDGVVGSFGGNLSPVLVMFVLAGMMYPLARWNRGLMPGWQVVGIFVVGVAVILLGEVKAVLVWLPVAVAYILRRRVLRNVLYLMMFCCLSTAFLAGTYTAYKAMYWTVHKKDDTLAEKVDSIIGYAIDPDNINYRTGEVSRGASIALWYRDPVPGPIKKLIGYGPGSTIISANTGMGQVAKRYRGLTVGSTAVSTLLWDVGLIGLFAWVSFLAVGVWNGWRYGKVVKDPERGAMADTSTAILGLIFTTIVYNRSLIDEPTAQLLAFFCLGCIVQLRRFDQDVAKVEAPRALAPAGPFLAQTS